MPQVFSVASQKGGGGVNTIFLVRCIGRDNRVFANPFDTGAMGEPVRQTVLSAIDELADCFDKDVTPVA